MDNIEGLTLGFWRPTAGGVYPILKKMEASGLVKGEWEKVRGKRRKIYTITPEGKNLISRALEKQKIITDAIRRLQSEFAFEFLDISPSKISKFPSPHQLFSFGRTETIKERSEEHTSELQSRM